MKKTTALCLLLVCVYVNAQEAMPYYQAVVPVRSQSAEDRKFAAQKGMQEVLVRMSASERVLQNAQVQSAIDRAQSYLEQYQFRLVEDEALKEKGFREEMKLVFSPELIQQLLVNKARERYWAEGNRPKILVWLVEDNAQYGKQILNAANSDNNGDMNPVVDALNAEAKTRGLPFEFPLLDLEDQMAISSQDLWRFDEEKIRAASARYSAPVILVGRFSTTSRGELWSTWQYYHLSFSQSWDSRESELDKFTSAALAPLNEFLAERYAIVPGIQGHDAALVLHLAGIDSFKHFRQALDYLSGLAMVLDVNVIEARSGELLLALHSEANLERFKTAVQLHKKIEFLPQQSELPAWQQLPEGTRENPVRYRWQGT